MSSSSEQQAPLFTTSIKISQTAKGAATVDVHCYSNNLEAARVQAVQQYEQTIADLKSKGLTVASAEGVTR